jgi:ribosome assembly protein YihI (activator of Der GTPase)
MRKNVDIETSPKEKCQDAIDEEETNKRRTKKKQTKHKQKTSGKRVQGGGTSQKHCSCHLDSSYAAFVLVSPL